MALDPLQTNVARLQPSGRVIRRPQHTFQVRHKPFCITPFCIAPVLPGETLKNALYQSRCVTDPIKNPLIGWHLEHYWFYVKHIDLDGSADYKEMMLNVDKDMSAYNATANAKYYQNAEGLGWVGPCLKVVTEEFFRDYGEAWTTYEVDGLPVAKCTDGKIFQSMLSGASFPTEDVEEDDPIEVLSEEMRTWQYMVQMGMTTMSYEDYIGTFGVKLREQDVVGRPELLRVTKSWQYPSNTVNPETGVPASAVSWAISERIDKDRFFKYPGFIFGVTIARPKVYLGNQRGSGVQYLSNAFGWLPALLQADHHASLKKFSSTEGPMSGVATGDYWLDLRDLFVHGDQFVNFDIASTDANFVPVPGGGLSNKRYPIETGIDALFASDTKEYVRQDGVVQFAIAGQQRDFTP